MSSMKQGGFYPALFAMSVHLGAYSLLRRKQHRHKRSYMVAAGDHVALQIIYKGLVIYLRLFKSYHPC